MDTKSIVWIAVGAVIVCCLCLPTTMGLYILWTLLQH
jgi:hypothetical protein